MAWPPRVGERLPKRPDAWFEQPKWSEWILSARGHGLEWEAILRIGRGDVDALWDAIAAEVVEAPVFGVRVAPDAGMLCEVRSALALRGRTALAITVWHLARDGAAPRLVTAYPRPYSHEHGSEK